MSFDSPDPEYLNVPVGQLKGRQRSGEFSGSALKRLKRMMLAGGFDRKFPIDIADIDGRKIIIDGHHRARAAGAAGISEVPVRIVAVTPEQEITLLEQAAEAAEALGLPF